VSFWESAFPLGWGYEVALRAILSLGCVVFLLSAIWIATSPISLAV